MNNFPFYKVYYNLQCFWCSEGSFRASPYSRLKRTTTRPSSELLLSKSAKLQSLTTSWHLRIMVMVTPQQHVEEEYWNWCKPKHSVEIIWRNFILFRICVKSILMKLEFEKTYYLDNFQGGECLFLRVYTLHKNVHMIQSCFSKLSRLKF